MRGMIVATGLALAGCGGGGGATTVVVQSNDTMSTVATTATGAAATGADCATRPDFAPVYPGAAIRICNAAHIDATGKDAGSIIYRTDAAPAVVLAWTREQALKAGLTPRVETGNMFSAGEGIKRTMMAHAEAKDGGTSVVLNWGKAP